MLRNAAPSSRFQFLLFWLTTAVTALNTVYFKRLMNCFKGEDETGEVHDYAVFVSVLDILLWAILMSVLLAAAGHRGAAATHFRRGELLRIAAADQLGTVFAMLGAPYVPGQTQVLLNQAVLPLTMLMSLALGRRYVCIQVLGAVLVLGGSSVAAGLVGGLRGLGLAAPRGLGWFCAAQWLVAGAGLLKETTLRQVHSLGLFHAQAALKEDSALLLGVAVAWLRVPMGVAMALAFHAGSGGGLLEDFRDGWFCFCGFEPRPGDSGCRGASGLMALSVALYAAQTLVGLWLTQCGSATLRSISAVTAVPLAQLLFTSETLMSEAGAESYSGAAGGGLLLCVGGFMLYLRGQRLEVKPRL